MQRVILGDYCRVHDVAHRLPDVQRSLDVSASGQHVALTADEQWQTE